MSSISRRRGPLPLLLFAALVAALSPACSERPALASARLADLDGRSVEPLAALRDAKALVYVFTSVECPIANRYAPELERLRKTFSPRGVAFALVYPNADETPETIRAHVAEYGLGFEALRDSRHDLVRAVGATVTPEAVVIGKNGALAYRGRIDDRFVDFGETRPRATRHDLADAIEAVLAGRKPETGETKAIGCFIAKRP